MTTPARTFVDCSEELRTEHLIALGDAVLHDGLATQDVLADMVEWAWGRRGVRNARRALPHLDAASESPGESLVRAHLVLDGLPRPTCNLNVYAGSVWIARVDLAWPGFRVIVEYDGAVHLENNQRIRDARRRNELQQAGWLVITFTSADLAQPWTIVARVKGALRARAALCER